MREKVYGGNNRYADGACVFAACPVAALTDNLVSKHNHLRIRYCKFFHRKEHLLLDKLSKNSFYILYMRKNSGIRAKLYYYYILHSNFYIDRMIKRRGGNLIFLIVLK